ncbi:MAG: O-succinylhomoserine sulfhydrylase [Rickettsiales bacterium]|nr:O-succinylhomoserine sulfhydrylase [Rickettsiales bacterium]
MTKSTSVEGKGLQTKLVRGGTKRSQFGEVSEAIYLNSGFCYDSAETAESRFNGEAPGFVYSRYLNPTLAMLEERLALLEGAEACSAMASGMAAVHASMMSFLKTGDHVVANRVLFGSCYYIITEILPRFGISYTLVDDVADVSAWEAAMTDKTTCVFIETPANPILTVTDIQAVSNITKKNGARLIVDNIFATPMYQKPLELGADVVVYSTTKHMDGQGRTLGGAVLGDVEFINETVVPYFRHTGPALSPFNAWVILKSLETFDLRMERHTDNAEAIAKMLEEHPKVERVFYPHLPSHPQYEIAAKQMKRGGGLVAFAVKGKKDDAFKVMNGLEVIDISNNLGDAKSLITHPATTTHSNIDEATRNDMGITENVMRLSVGLESAHDLLNDLDQALAAL